MSIFYFESNIRQNQCHMEHNQKDMILNTLLVKLCSEATDVDAAVAVKTSLPEETVLAVETSLTQAVKTSAAQESSKNVMPENSKPTTQKTQENQKSVTLQPVIPKSVTPKLKREILHRDQFCQFKDVATGRVCGAKLFLEIEHTRPRFAR